MYSKILVAVDGSSTSQRALDEALKLASGGQCAVRALYVIDSPAMLFGVGFYDPSSLKDAFTEEGNVVTRAAQQRFAEAGVAGDTLIVDAQEVGNDVVGAISSAATQWGADLVVLGTHGRRGMQRALLGSIAEAFVRVAPTPVLLVRSEETDEGATRPATGAIPAAPAV
ncbi:universal stress protein [Chitinasiproducens palmae]|uniref:Nucleotide-binding universal stress protein, UspA family n=1 Tax=Chitinasiproducens palmae TaxID=1770053 RepID=A0A1H2PUC6_9BURK|nr:universal stress protein [Chitinasiproducens palmae]SDV49965.1 Nucleotide-binding universal stress protein, UspA family [Chitinasiproducens palmae]